MVPKVLIVKVIGGLCNRMRTLSSADRWATATGRHMYYSWPVGPKFGASLDDLWMHSYRHVSGRVVGGLSRVVGGYREAADITLHDQRRLLLMRTESVLFRDNAELEPWFAPLRRLSLVPELADRVNETARGWAGRPAVGVMIRAHANAHQQTREASPPEWFFARMKAIRAEDPEMQFFVSTDSPEVSSAIHAEFDGVVELKKRGAYNTRVAVADSVCDLYLLAGTTYILGSHYSSFSEVAAALSDHGGYETSKVAATEPFSVRRLIATGPPVPH
ncbi:MAG: hypothetical protein QOC92_3075 [Acidimicrobiaceae bacterium]|jgi:hypothetical protein